MLSMDKQAADLLGKFEKESVKLSSTPTLLLNPTVSLFVAHRAQLTSSTTAITSSR